MYIRLLDTNIGRVQVTAKLFEQVMRSRKIEGRAVCVPEHLEICRKGHTSDNTAVEVDGTIVCKGTFSKIESVESFFNVYFEKFGANAHIQTDEG